MAKKFIINEITNLREVNKKVYLMSDGSYKAVYYPTTVHTLNEETGTYEEIVSTLSDETVTSDTSQSYVGIINYDQDVATNDTAAEIGFVYDTNSTEYSRKYISHLQISLPTLQNNPNIKRVTLALNELTDECSMTDYITVVGMYSYNSEEDYNKSINNCMDYFSHSHFSDAKPLLDITKQAVEFYHQLSQDSIENNQNYFEVILKMEDITLSSPVTEGTKLTCRYSVNLEIEYESSYPIKTSGSVHSHNIGRFGTGFIDLITGNLMFESEDFAWSGNKMPVTIRHLYNSSLSNVPYTKNTDIHLNVADYSSMSIGNGWKLNLMQSMVKIGENYIFTDEYGTETAFTFKEDQNNTSVYESEDGLKFDESTNILDFGEEKYHFDSAGRLIKIADSYNEMNITYTDDKIIAVTDGAGREFTFGYNDNKLTSITAPDESTVTYGYVGENLSSIIYSDDRHVKISYHTYIPSEIKLYDNDSNEIYKIVYNSTITDFKKVTCVEEVVIEDNNYITGEKTEYNYSPFGKSTYITSYIENSNLDYISNQYVFIYDEHGNKVNEYMISNDIITEVESSNGINPYSECIGTNLLNNNIIKNSDFTDTYTDTSGRKLPSNWTIEDYPDSDTIEVLENEKNAWNGTNFLKMQYCNVVNQSIALTAGTYVFSAYIKVTEDFGNDPMIGAYLIVYENSYVSGISSEKIRKPDNNYRRVSVTFTLSKTQTVKLSIMTEGLGIAYFDCISLVKSSYCLGYNLLNDTLFNKNENNLIEITGDLNLTKNISQTIAVKTEKEIRENFTFSAWGKAESLPYSERCTNQNTYRLRAVLNYTDNDFETFIADFNPLNTDWQLLSINIEKSKFKEVLNLQIYCDYDYNCGTAYFNNICLIKNYIETDLTEDDFEEIYVDDSENNVEESTEETTEESTESEYEFKEVVDDYGNSLTDTFFNEGSFGTLYRSYAYNITGNDLISTTDERNNTTLYNVDSVHSRNISTTDRVGNKTILEYDDSNRIKKVKNQNLYDIQLSNASYEYDAFDNLTNINRGDGLGYELKYDIFNRPQSINIKGKDIPLISNYYHNNNGKLKKSYYANSQYVSFQYNDLGQLTKLSWNDEKSGYYQYCDFEYDNNGNLIYCLDSVTGNKYNYMYDNGRLISKRIIDKMGVTIVSYIYNSDGQLIRKEYSLSDCDSFKYEYESTEEGNVKAIFNLNNKRITATSQTDNFGRKIFDEIQTQTGVISRRFDYFDGVISQTHIDNSAVKSTPITNLIKKITLSDGRKIKYEYDAEERVTKVIDSVDGITEYIYDSLGQLLTEKHKGINEKEYTIINEMTYDNYGNILTKNGITYKYGDSNWKDLLTECGENIYVYDALGNPTTYKDNVLNWVKGRQLQSYGENTYLYNYDGVRIGKTVYSDNGAYHFFELDGTKIVREYWDGNTIYPLYDDEDNVCGIIYNNSTYFFHKNLQGDIISITNTFGAVVARYSYDAWGVCTIIKDTTECKIADVNPFRYRGYYYDAETGLYYLQSRYYDPTIGRFINADVPELATIDQNVISHNLFAYCGNDSVNFSDEFGYVRYKTKNKTINKFIDKIEKLIPNIYSDDFYAKEKTILKIGTTNLGVKFIIGASLQSNKNALFGALFKRKTIEVSSYFGISNNVSFAFTVGINWRKAYLKTGICIALSKDSSGKCIGAYIELSVPTWILAAITVAVAVVSIYAPAIGAYIAKLIATIRSSIRVATPIIVPLIPAMIPKLT